MTQESSNVPLDVLPVVIDVRALQEVAKQSNSHSRFRFKMEVEVENGPLPTPKPSPERTLKGVIVGFGRVVFALLTGRPLAHSRSPAEQSIPD